MSSPALRRSDRVSLTLVLEVSGTDSHGQTFKEPARTLLLNRSGAVIALDRELAPEQRIHLWRKAPSEAHRHGDVRIVGQFGRQKEGYLYGVEILDPATDLWGIEFPEIALSTEAVARMLLECNYCRRREVAYLNELELHSFETDRGIARHCTKCGVPSIWTQAPHEDAKKSKARSTGTRRESQPQKTDAAASGHTERRRARLKTRLTACVRQDGADDELAVCEDISPIGMCFRSKRRYDTGALVTVAVPYAPDTANIFLPARVIYSEELPKAGLFRHGTEYVRPRSQPS